MPLIAGLDRSDTPDPRRQGERRQIYTVCVAGVSVSQDELRSVFSELRQDCIMGLDEEFHGRDCPEWIQAKLLYAAQTLGLRVAAIMYEKTVDSRAAKATGSQAPSAFQARVGLELLEKFFARYEVQILRCDEDVQGAQQKVFEKLTRHAHRQIWPDSKIVVRHRPSTHDDLIQLADIVAYGLSRQARGLVSDPDLLEILRAIVKAPENIVEGPLPWETDSE